MQKELDSKKELYRDFIENLHPTSHVGKVTATDLYLNELFDHLDCTSSWPGRQILYSRIQRQNFCGYSDADHQLMDRLANDELLRSKIHALLTPLNSQDASGMMRLFSLELPVVTTQFINMVRLLQLLAVGLVVLLFTGFFQFSIVGLIVLLIFNLILHYKNKLNLSIYDSSIPQITKLIKCAEKLLALDISGENSAPVYDSIVHLKAATKSIRWFKQPKILLSDLAIIIWALQELLKIITLIEVYAFNVTLMRLAGNQASLRIVYEFVGNVDVMNCIAKIRCENENTCVPVFLKDSNSLRCSNVTHPLVENCVKNSLTMDGKSVLLTGSNMSGKSTFIRAIGVNVLMAQNLLIAFADHFELSNPLHIHTVMNVHDDLLDSKSLFFSEVLAIKDLLNSSQSGNQLFLMDEMFKGTNTIERVAAANGVLSYLAEKNMVVVATHDVELTDLLADKYELYHFCEQVNDGRIYFDYSLKKGVITEFNALKILKYNEYPQEVLDKAYSTIINTNCL